MLKAESQKQNVGPKDTVIDNVYDLCSFKLKVDRVVAAKPSSTTIGTQRSSKEKGSSKKVKMDRNDQVEKMDRPAVAGRGIESKSEGKSSKRRISEGSVDSDDYATGAGPRKISSRSMRSSPSSSAVDERPPKKRKLEKNTARVSVLKVPPAAFPKEMRSGKDLNPSAPDDMNKVFCPDGSFPVDEAANPIGGNSPKYQDLIASDSHFHRCAECKRDDVGLVLCKTCPRAYHEKCLEDPHIAIEDDGGGGTTDSTSGLRVKQMKDSCKRCECDRQVTESEMDKVSDTEKTQSQNYTTIGVLLCELQQILEKLILYDYGYIFASPGELVSIFLHVMVLIVFSWSDRHIPLSFLLILSASEH